MEENVDLKVTVEVSEAERGLDTVNSKLGETKETLEEVNDTLDETVDKTEDLGKASEGGIGKVSGLGKAFESAFNVAVKEADKTGSSLKTVFGSVKDAIPVVKNINSTAISGLKGVKAAIASTGIGLLVIAITTLMQHWEGFTHVVGISGDKFKEFKKTALTTLSNIVSGIVGVGNVVVQYLLTPIRTAIQAFKGLGNIVKDIFTGHWSDVKQHAEEAFNGIKDAFTKAIDVTENYNKGKEYGQKFLNGVQEVLTYKSDEGKKVTEGSRALGKEAGKAFSEGFSKEVEGILKAYESAVKKADNIVGDIADNKVLEQKLKEAAQEFEGYSESAIQSIAKTRIEFENQTQTLNEALTETQNTINRLKQLSPTNAEEKAEVERLLAELEEDRKTYYQAIEDLEAEHQKKLKGIQDQEVEENKKRQEKEEEDRKKSKEKAETPKVGTSATNGRFLPTKEEWDNAKGNLQDLANLLDDYWGKWAKVGEGVATVFGSMSDLYEQDSEAIKKNAEIKFQNNEISEKQYKEELERSKKQFERAKKLQVATTVINTISGAIGAFLQATAAYPPPAGPIIGAATAAAATAAGIAQIQALKSKSFDSTDIGGSVSPSANVGVTPVDVRDDIKVSPTTLAQSQSPADQRVYILEGDIQDSNKRVEIREANSTF